MAISRIILIMSLSEESLDTHSKPPPKTRQEKGEAKPLSYPQIQGDKKEEHWWCYGQWPHPVCSLHELGLVECPRTRPLRRRSQKHSGDCGQGAICEAGVSDVYTLSKHCVK